MNKIISLWNRHFKRQNGSNDFIQEELTRTFFTPSVKKRTKTPKTLFLIAISAVFLAFVFILLNSKMKILGFSKKKNTFLIKDGEPDKYLVKDIFFSGDAQKFSKEKSDSLVLINSRGSGWANVSIELKEPVNMKKLDIAYIARGQTGDEYLVLTLVDANNTSYRMERDLSSALTKEWEKYTINFGSIKNAIDMGNIVIIKLEFGSLTAGNYPCATIFLRDILVTKKRDVGWL